MEEKLGEAKKILFESSKRFNACSVYMLKVPNFFCLPEYKECDVALDSPPFEFDNATWHFRFFNHEEEAPDQNAAGEASSCNNGPRGCLDVHIFRLTTEVTEQEIFYKIALLNADNVECDALRSAEYFATNESPVQVGLCSFESELRESFVGCDTVTVIIHLFTLEAMDAKQELSKKDSFPTRTVEMKDCSFPSVPFLKSTYKTVPSMFYSLKLPNVFSKGKNFDLSSSSFKFADAACCFYFRSKKSHSDRFSVGLKVYFAEKPLRNVFIKYILINNDEELKNVNDYFDFEETSGLYEITSIDKFESPFCTLNVYLLLDVELEDPASITRARDLDVLSRDLRQLFLDGKNCDLSLRVAEKEFRVHRSILMARSPVLEAMLTHDMIERNEGVVEIPDVDRKAMELLLVYVYSGDVDPLNWDNAPGVYYAADKYSMAFLKKESAEFMKKSLSPSMICDVIRLALTHNDKDLLECSKNYFVNHVSDILPTIEWMEFMKSNAIEANELFILTTKRWESKM